MTVVLGLLAGVIGLAIGSFLNVVAYRVPARMSIVHPASACPGCGHPIRRRDNVPLLSWMMLGGRCRDCRTPISARYPLVEALTAAMFVAVALLFSGPIASAVGTAAVIAAVLQLLAFCYLAAISVALSAIDLDVRRLPNVIVLPSYLVAVALLVPSALLAGTPGVLVPAAAGMLASLLFYGILWFVAPGGMGFGDVKLAGLLGIYLGYLGWAQLLVGVGAAFVLGGLYGLVLIIIRRAGRKSKVPFGPWMFAGAWIGIVAGAQIAHGYLDLFGLG